MLSRLPFSKSISFPVSLPVVQYLDQIRIALTQHQVIVVAGETGSGKTTQLPKLLLELGYGVSGWIGHTQPRRIATRSVAARLAEELQVTLGVEVGYQVRFQHHVSDSTYIKLMTDGVLLAELAHDPLLKKYDALIIDEAHERSLNIDFILGYLKWILPKRPDLKIIITSATLDHQRFSMHFGNCPVMEVSGRTYPVTIRYQAMPENENATRDLAQIRAMVQAIEMLTEEDPRGDILVFLSGERDIREADAFLRKTALSHTEILPLFSRLSAKEQQKVFQPHALRRIILSTNVAETSLTIPGIRFVIDTGLARIKRYNTRSKIQRLPIEAISQASAQQRAGRCGRTSEGICVRLYSEEDFKLREKYTEPEILRSNLASVILQMLLLGLGEPESFPWLDPPESIFWRDAYQCLEELQAIQRGENQAWRLTATGKLLARLPLDPRLGRMLVTAAEKECLHELIIIVCALSVADIFLRPEQSRTQAAQKHAHFIHPESDFLTYLNLWQALEEIQRHESNNKLRQFCEKHFLSYLICRDWQDLVHELRAICGDIFSANKLAKAQEEISFEKIHQSILSGILTNIAQKTEDGNFLAARQRLVKIFPGSSLFKKPPAWIMAMEIVETKQIYARIIAKIDPAWVEELAPQLIKKNYSEPHWDEKRGEVMANEKVLFFGLPIIPRRRVRYASLDAMTAHEVFLREALSERRLQSDVAFWRHNEKFLLHLESLEEKTRSRHVVPDALWLYHFYENKIPTDISGRVAIEKWFRQLAPEAKENLMLSEAHLDLTVFQGSIEKYPTEWSWEGNIFKLDYQFSPDSSEDGVSIRVPLSLLSQLPNLPFEWLVPGFLLQKVIAILKGLPLAMRQKLIPLQEAAETLTAELMLCSRQEDFYQELSRYLRERFTCEVAAEALRQIILPSFLKFNFKIFEEKKLLEQGRDLFLLKSVYVSDVSEIDEGEGVFYTSFPSEGLLETERVKEKGFTIKRHLALYAVSEGVQIYAYDHLLLAQQVHTYGIIKLLRLHCVKRLQYVLKSFWVPSVLEISKRSSVPKAWPLFEFALGDFSSFISYLETILVRMTFVEDFWRVRTPEAFACCLNTHEKDLVANAESLNILVRNLLAQLLKTPVLEDDCAFMAQVPWEWLERYPLYVAAKGGSTENEKKLAPIKPCVQYYEQLLEKKLHKENMIFSEAIQISSDPELFFRPELCLSEHYMEAYFMLKELAVSLVFPAVKPVASISVTRMQKILEKLS